MPCKNIIYHGYIDKVKVRVKIKFLVGFEDENEILPFLFGNDIKQNFVYFATPEVFETKQSLAMDNLS